MFEQEYREAFSQVKASDKLRMEVLNMKTNTKTGLRKLPRLALAAIMVLLLTACAVGFNALDMLEAAFGENGKGSVEKEKIYLYTDEDGHDKYMSWNAMERVTLDTALAEELVEPYVVPVNQSIKNESDGTVLTAEAYLVDFSTKTGAVYLSLENPDGFPNYSVANTGLFVWGRKSMDKDYLSSVPWGLFYYDEQRSTDTKLYLILRCVMGEDATEMKLYFKETEQELVFPVTGSDIRSISMDDGNVVLSPMGLYLANRAPGNLPGEMVISYRDGSEYLICGEISDKFNRKTTYSNFYFAMGSTGEIQAYSYCLNRIVDIDNVKSITINGTEYFPD